jgi:hypothetical protein
MRSIRTCSSGALLMEGFMIRVKTQLSVVIENRPGVLTRLCDALSSHNINIEGFSAYGETEHGIVRIVTEDAERAVDILADRGFLVTRTDVVAVKLANRPAGLLRLARQLAAEEINIHYAYGSAGQAGRLATIYLRVDEPQRASQLLAEKKPRPSPGGHQGHQATRSKVKAKATSGSESKTKRKPLTARRRPAGRY